jgi:hypothetical protein
VSKLAFGYVGAWNNDNKDDATFNILIDTGAFFNISGQASDFVGGLSGLVSLQPGSTINGLNGPTAAKGIGELLWQVVDDDGTIVLFAALVIMFPVPRCDYSVHKLSSANTKPADSLLTPTG